MRLSKGLVAVLFFLIALTLTACGQTQLGEEIRGEVADRGRTAADATLKNLEYLYCNSPTIGAIQRRYGKNPTVFDSYISLCGHEWSRPILEE